MKLGLVLLLSSISGSASADSWICISEAATGFTFVGNVYVSEPFKAGRTYLMRPSKASEIEFTGIKGMTYTFETIGSNEGPYAYFTGDVKIDGYVVPSVGGSVNVEFNPSTLKFTLASTQSYIFQMEANKFRPFFEIGSCSEM
jgi:hypothetical protein